VQSAQLCYGSLSNEWLWPLFRGRIDEDSFELIVDKLWTTEIGERKDVAVSTQKFESRWLVGCHRNVSPYLRHNKAKAYLTFSQIESYLRCNYNDKHQQHSAVFFFLNCLSVIPFQLTALRQCRQCGLQVPMIVGKTTNNLVSALTLIDTPQVSGRRQLGAGFPSQPSKWSERASQGPQQSHGRSPGDVDILCTLMRSDSFSCCGFN